MDTNAHPGMQDHEYLPISTTISESVPTKYKICWAKQPLCPWWPCIAEYDKHSDNRRLWVYWLGTSRRSLISQKQIVDFGEHLTSLYKRLFKQKAYQQGCQMAVRLMAEWFGCEIPTTLLSSIENTMIRYSNAYINNVRAEEILKEYKSARKLEADKGGTNFPCSLCSRVFHSSMGRLMHIRQSHIGMQWRCLGCEKVCSNSYHFRVCEKAIKLRRSGVQSSICLPNSKPGKQKQYNLQCQQQKPKNIVCSHCGRTVSGSTGLRNHLLHSKACASACTVVLGRPCTARKSVTTGTMICAKSPVKRRLSTNSFCHLCPFETAARDKYLRHLHCHKTPGMYKCDFCSYQCNDNLLIKQHSQLHFEGFGRHTELIISKPVVTTAVYKCFFCQRMFQHDNEYLLHQQLHLL